jgi:hypothetical protein
MHIEKQNYRGKPTDILYADDGFQLQHKQTKLCYGSVSLEDGRKQEDYIEIPEPEDDEQSING